MPAITDHLRYSLAQELCPILSKPFENLDLDPHELYSWLTRPKDPSHGDYAIPCFRLAKPLKLNPKMIAETMAKQCADAQSSWIAKAEAVAGFLNLTLAPKASASFLLPRIHDGRYFKVFESHDHHGTKVMVEYSQPNTHKAFHVGHIRNVALGDSLGRLFKYGGYDVIMVNYLGDEGAHIAKCLWQIQKGGEDAPQTHRGTWLDQQYRRSNAALDAATPEEKAAIEKDMSSILAAIESKEGPTYELWQKTRTWSVEDFQEIYTWFGAHFDHWFSESEVSEASQDIVQEYLEKGVFVEDDGAIGLDLKDDKLGFVILRKRDGNTLYATKDLALARRKYDEYDITKSIYVVASEQNLHFKQVFRTLEKMGFPQAKDCFHLSYGMVNLPEGKMSTRKGTTVSFDTLRNEVLTELDKHLEKYKGDWPEEEIKVAKHKIAVGAIRYGMINTDPVKDLVFNLEDWTSFEGNSGPYLIYAYARTNSILTKGEAQGLNPSDQNLHLLEAPEEVELMRHLNDFNNSVEQSLGTYKISILSHHLFDTCKVYSRFLANCLVLKGDHDELKEARLYLCKAFSLVLHRGLALIGISPPERM